MKGFIRNALCSLAVFSFVLIAAVMLSRPISAHAMTPINQTNFDHVKYADMHPDLQAVFGYDAALLWQHYLDFGVFEGRKVFTKDGDAGYLLIKETFDFVRYADQYADLKAAFGYDLDGLWQHYSDYGQYEGRQAYSTTDEIGIDVSSYQGNINWTAVKNSGIDYAIIRLGIRGSETGRIVTDSKFHQNIQNAQAAGIRVGVYFFTQAITEAEAVEEAAHCLHELRNYTLQLPVFLDIEGTTGRGFTIDRTTRTALAQTFCQTMTANGRAAGIYSNLTWFNNHLDVHQLTAYSIWYAQYAPAKVWDKTRVDMWQFSSSGSVNGIIGRVDMNRIYVKW